MSVIAQSVAVLAEEIARLTSTMGEAVLIDTARVADRSADLDLKDAGVWSPNRNCRLVRTADDWIAVNLPRETDQDSVPAWVGCGFDADPWAAVVRRARKAQTRALLAGAVELGLPVARVGETVPAGLSAPVRRMAAGALRGRRPLRVVDLSSLWAGPLCGDILARMGAAVTRIESRWRPETARESAPAFFERMNGRKTHQTLDFTDAGDVDALGDAVAGADVLITSARPRAFDHLGLSPPAVFARNPGLTWVAVSGYGWTGPQAGRVAFGDDAAAAGGLVRWTARGEPRFLGDALADPLTGLAAAVGALRAVARGGGRLVDAALARTAAGAAAHGRRSGPGGCPGPPRFC